jgi:hypothetical protein
MECSQLPAAAKWEDASEWQLNEYRSHVKFCRSCRARMFREAPDQLLFELSEPELPEDFWIGFWDSLRKRITPRAGRPHHNNNMRLIRWAVALVVIGILMINKPVQEPPPAVDNEYPLIEDIQSPTATYYIFQPENDAKIVMVFDPKMDL